MKVLTIGSAVRDVFIEYDTTQTLRLDTLSQEHQAFIILEEGKKVEVSNVLYRTGGGATNSAVAFVRLGHETVSFFKVGNDEQGQFIKNKLIQEHVDVSPSVESDTYATGTSFIIPCPSGNRAALVYRGASLTIQKDELPYKTIENVDYIYITTLSAQAAELLPIITKYAHQYKTPVAVNPGTTQMEERADTLRQALPNIDILIVNKHEASLLMLALCQEQVMPKAKQVKTSKKMPILLDKIMEYQTICFSLPQFFELVHSLGPKIVVVTNGAEGVYASSENAIYFHPSIKTKLVSSLGAGDAFGSCFVGSLLQGYSIEEAMLAGVINSASVINYLDAKQGLLTQQQLKERIKEVGFNQVLKFSLD